jgi:hypothetical protein
MKRLLTVALLLVALPVAAKDLQFVTGLGQSEFKDFSKEAGAALAYPRLAPATPLGITGFEIGVEASAIDIRDKAFYWQAAFAGDAPSYLYVPSIRARKGLPFGIDIGAMYSYVPDTNAKLFGGEVSYALLKGGAALPAIGVRGTYTKLTGVDDLDLQTYGVDATISKGLLFITPYVGVGTVYIDSKAKGNLQKFSTLLGTPLKEEKFWQERYFGGIELKPFPLFRLVAEAEYCERPIYSAKISIGF